MKQIIMKINESPTEFAKLTEDAFREGWVSISTTTDPDPNMQGCWFEKGSLPIRLLRAYLALVEE